MNGASSISCSGGNQTLSSGTATCQTSFPSNGTSSLTAVYSGDTADAGSTSGALSQVVNAAATSTTLASSANPSIPGQTVTYTATVVTTGPGSGTPTGTVTFKDGSTVITCTGGAPTLNAGTATCSLAYATTSTGHAITAVYDGTPSYSTSTSTVLSQVVNSATSTVVTTSTTAKTGAALTLTAKVTATLPGTGTPSGTVVFKDAGTAISCTGSQTLNALGVATCVTSFAGYGNHAITAVYSGGTGYAGSTSSAVTQKVVNAAVAGLVFTGITSATGTCPGSVGASYSCSVTGGPNAVVSTGVAFADSTGALTAYSSDPQTFNYTIAGRNTGSGSVTVTGGTSTSTTTITATKQGNTNETITVTFTDGVSTFSAVLTIN
jgi:hypothetical protein